MTVEALSDRQIRALAHRSRQRETGDSDFARGVNDTAGHIAAVLRSFEDDPDGLAGHLRARVRGGTRWEKTAYEDGVAAVLDDVAGILDNDSDTISAVIYRGRTQFAAAKGGVTMMKPLLEWEIQWQYPYGSATIWTNNGTMPDSRGVHRLEASETPEQVAQALVRDHLPKDGAYQIAIWDTVGVGKPPILLASWDENDAVNVRPYETTKAA